jgi:hypothetical protein
MMALNLLAIVTTMAGEAGLPLPVSVVGNPDAQVQQLYALSNREGRELANIEGGWETQRGEQLITTIIGQATYAFPTDFAYYVQATFWDRNNRWPVAGPMSPQAWQTIKSGLLPSGVNRRFRIMNGAITIDPTPTDVTTLAIEYISSNWCQSATGIKQSQFLADTDTPLFPDDLFILGLKWRFLAAKGFNYAEEKAAYDLALSRLHPRDYVTQDVNMGGNRRYESFLNPGLYPNAGIPL